MCDGHWSKKLEVNNQLIRRLSNKLLFRHEKSRAEPEASNSLRLNPPTLSGVLEHSGRFTFPLPPSSQGPGPAIIQKSMKNIRFYKVYELKPSKTS